MKKATWQRKDVGCYADGAFGHDHLRGILGELLSATYREHEPAYWDSHVGAVHAALGEQDSDDLWEEDEALDLLNLRTEEGIGFQFVDGDLLLILDTELEA